MFQDHAILQRDKPIQIYGRAKPGAEVTVELGEATSTARANEIGDWSATLPALPAGGPYTLLARTGWRSEAKAKDILVGDVFLCSGQSNMVLQVHRTLDSRSEIQNARNDRIRMLTVGEAASPLPLAAFVKPVQWLPTTPETVRDFSATCYYFARELQKTVDVPIGLVIAAWGGSKIETWTSAAGLEAIGGYEDAAEILKTYVSDRPAAARAWGDVWEAWWKGLPSGNGAEPWSTEFKANAWDLAPKDLGFWDNWGRPALQNFAGMVWYRTTIPLSDEQAEQGARLSLGGVDEIDQTWVNGISVGGGAAGDRTYEITPGILRAGDNTITVNVLNTYKLGGLTGPASQQSLRLKDGTAIPLGPWLYKQDVAMNVARPPRAPWEPIAGLSMAYNAMIAPIGPYGFRGAVWYQGEANTNGADPARYGELLRGLMADWRGTYGADLPFLIVQLAAFGAAPTGPGESGWAEVRQAQAEVVAADAHADLAVTVDIGDRYDVHPANKQELGRRLARAARHVVYGENTIPTGPTATAAWPERGSVVVSFKDIGEGGLVAHGYDGPIGFEVCGAERGSCRYAPSRIVGGNVVLVVTRKGRPTRVRYCWANSPVCTLFDKTGLPAGPFELAIEAPPQRATAANTKR
jgi:sialate O-acetylesterase